MQRDLVGRGGGLRLMDRAMRNYLVRRYALGPVLRVTTHLLAGFGLAFPSLQKRIREPVFIVGCSRSGTTLFAEIFGTHPDVCNVMDAAQVWDLGYYDRNGDDHRTERDATPWEASRVRTSFALRSMISGGGRLVNKNNQNSLRLRFIHRLWPDARIVHVLRDARPVVLSNVSRLDKDSYRRLFPFGRFPKPVAWRSYLDKPLVEQFAHQWRDVTATARTDGRELFGTERYLEIRFEDFCREPEKTLREADAFCGLRPVARTPEALAGISSGESDEWRTRLGGTDLARILEIAGPQLAQFGYAAEATR
jgi:hypothetical protein